MQPSLKKRTYLEHLCPVLGVCDSEPFTPYTPHPTPYTPHTTTHTLHPTTYTLHPTPYTPHPTPYTLHPTPYTLHLTPCTLHPTPYTLRPTPYTLHPSRQGAGAGCSAIKFQSLHCLPSGLFMNWIRVVQKISLEPGVWFAR